MSEENWPTCQACSMPCGCAKWSRGSLQWALEESDGRPVKRAGESAYMAVFYWAGDLVFVKSHLERAPKIKDLKALDWELCE